MLLLSIYFVVVSFCVAVGRRQVIVMNDKFTPKTAVCDERYYSKHCFFD